MRRLLYGLAALPFVAGVALAQGPTGPVPLTNQQMDQVTAGWDLLELDRSNTSITAVSVYNTPNTISCSGCYLLINNKAISVASMMLGGP